MEPRALKTWIAVLVLLLVGRVAIADVTIDLANSFIERYKNRVTIDAEFTVEKIASRIHPQDEDGDLHIAGRSPQVLLPMVTELKNARQFPEAVQAIRNSIGTAPVRVSGVWRLWCEHSGSGDHIQGRPVAPPRNSNPDHVSEIHPLIQFQNINLRDSLVPIDGYEPWGAERAFGKYEEIFCEITPGQGRTQIRTRLARYNHVEFVMQLRGEQYVVHDGRFVMASVHDTDGELVVRNRRMAFVKDTEPERRVRNLREGDCLRVMGMPRISLALVSWRAANAGTRPDALRWSLPYEIVVVGVYDDQPECQVDE